MSTISPVLITRASSGVGAAYAERFARRGQGLAPGTYVGSGCKQPLALTHKLSARLLNTLQ
jgi:NAD(P)-dependent dehydrogenase (short-subunit alcohol dehydrogenase family)